MTDDVADHVITTSELRVDLCADSDETTWDSIHELIVIRHQGDDHGLNFGPSLLTSSAALRDLARTNGDLIADLEAALQDGASSDTTLKSLSIFTRLVDIERADYNHVWRHSELSRRNGNTADVVNNNINIIAKNGRNGHDGDGNSRDTGQGPVDLLLLLSHSDFIFNHQIDFVL